MPGVLKNIDYTDPFTRYRGQKILDVVKRLGCNTRDIPLDLAIDVHYSLYLPFPELVSIEDVPLGNEKHYFLIKSLLSIEEVKKLRLYTVADSFASVAIGALILKYLLEEGALGSREEDEERIRGGGDRIKSMAPSESESEEMKKQEMSFDQMRRSVKRAVERALQAVQTVKEIKNLAYGYRAGVGHTLSLDDDVATVLKLATQTDVRNLLEWLSRIPSISAVIRKRKTRFSRGEIEGYTLGSDLERLVPTELAYPEIYFYAKLADSRLLLYDKYLYLSMGPIYVLIDKSGSMEGDKIRWAKATALALFMKSRLERRPFYVRFFDSEPFNLIKVRPNAKPSEVLKLVEYLAMVRSGGGTDISKAIITACNDIAKYRRREVSDIVLITDGEDRIARSLVRKCLNQISARLVSVMIMGDNPDLRKVSDRYLKVVKLDEKEMLAVVEA